VVYPLMSPVGEYLPMRASFRAARSCRRFSTIGSPLPRDSVTSVDARSSQRRNQHRTRMSGREAAASSPAGTQRMTVVSW